MPGDIGSLSGMTRPTRYTEYEWKVIRSSVLALEEELNNLSHNGRWEVFSVTPALPPNCRPLNAEQRRKLRAEVDFVIVARR
jgi:hypothetical protein